MSETLHLRRLQRNGTGTAMHLTKEMLAQLEWMWGDQVLCLVDPPYVVIRKVKPEDLAALTAEVKRETGRWKG